MYQTNPAKDFLTQIPLRGNKNCKPVSRILLHPVVWDGYHLSGIAIAGYLYLPTLPASAESGIERAIQKAGYTWHFSPQGLPEYYNLL